MAPIASMQHITTLSQQLPRGHFLRGHDHQAKFDALGKRDSKAARLVLDLLVWQHQTHGQNMMHRFVTVHRREMKCASDMLEVIPYALLLSAMPAADSHEDMLRKIASPTEMQKTIDRLHRATSTAEQLAPHKSKKQTALPRILAKSGGADFRWISSPSFMRELATTTLEFLNFIIPVLFTISMTMMISNPDASFFDIIRRAVPHMLTFFGRIGRNSMFTVGVASFFHKFGWDRRISANTFMYLWRYFIYPSVVSMALYWFGLTDETGGLTNTIMSNEVEAYKIFALSYYMSPVTAELYRGISVDMESVKMDQLFSPPGLVAIATALPKIGDIKKAWSTGLTNKLYFIELAALGTLAGNPMNIQMYSEPIMILLAFFELMNVLYDEMSSKGDMSSIQLYKDHWTSVSPQVVLDFLKGRSEYERDLILRPAVHYWLKSEQFKKDYLTRDDGSLREALTAEEEDDFLSMYIKEIPWQTTFSLRSEKRVTLDFNTVPITEQIIQHDMKTRFYNIVTLVDQATTGNDSPISVITYIQNEYNRLTRDGKFKTWATIYAAGKILGAPITFAAPRIFGLFFYFLFNNPLGYNWTPLCWVAGLVVAGTQLSWSMYTPSWFKWPGGFQQRLESVRARPTKVNQDRTYAYKSVEEAKKTRAVMMIDDKEYLMVEESNGRMWNMLAATGIMVTGFLSFYVSTVAQQPSTHLYASNDSSTIWGGAQPRWALMHDLPDVHRNLTTPEGTSHERSVLRSHVNVHQDTIERTYIKPNPSVDSLQGEVVTHVERTEDLFEPLKITIKANLERQMNEPNRPPDPLAEINFTYTVKLPPKTSDNQSTARFSAPNYEVKDMDTSIQNWLKTKVENMMIKEVDKKVRTDKVAESQNVENRDKLMKTVLPVIYDSIKSAARRALTVMDTIKKGNEEYKLHRIPGTKSVEELTQTLNRQIKPWAGQFDDFLLDYTNPGFVYKIDCNDGIVRVIMEKSSINPRVQLRNTVFLNHVLELTNSLTDYSELLDGIAALTAEYHPLATVQQMAYGASRLRHHFHEIADMLSADYHTADSDYDNLNYDILKKTMTAAMEWKHFNKAGSDGRFIAHRNVNFEKPIFDLLRYSIAQVQATVPMDRLKEIVGNMTQGDPTSKLFYNSFTIINPINFTNTNFPKTTGIPNILIEYDYNALYESYGGMFTAIGNSIINRFTEKETYIQKGQEEQRKRQEEEERRKRDEEEKKKPEKEKLERKRQKEEELERKRQQPNYRRDQKQVKLALKKAMEASLSDAWNNSTSTYINEGYVYGTWNSSMRDILKKVSLTKSIYEIAGMLNKFFSHDHIKRNIDISFPTTAAEARNWSIPFVGNSTGIDIQMIINTDNLDGIFNKRRKFGDNPYQTKKSLNILHNHFKSGFKHDDKVDVRRWYRIIIAIKQILEPYLP